MEVVVPRVAPAAVLVVRLRRVPPAPLVVPRQAQAAAPLGVVEVRQLVEPATTQTTGPRVRGRERESASWSEACSHQHYIAGRGIQTEELALGLTSKEAAARS